MKRNILALSLASVCLCSPLRAQSDNSNFSLHHDVLPWPPPANCDTGGTTHSTAGHFNGHLIPHAVLLRGNTPTLFFQPTSFEGAFCYPTTANDIATLRLSASQDELITVGSNGVARWSLSGTPLVATPLLIEGSSPYHDARRVWIQDIDLNGEEDIITLGADGQSLSFLTQINGIFDESLSFGFQHSSKITDVVFGQFDGFGNVDLAILDKLGLSFRRANGDVLADFASIEASKDVIAPFPNGSFFDRVLWCSSNQAEGFNFSLFCVDLSRRAMGDAIRWLDDTTEAIADMETGHFTDDDLLDAAFSVDDNDTFTFLYAFEEVGEFEPFIDSLSFDSQHSHTESIGGVPFPEDQSPSILVHDFSNDGILDLFHPVKSDNGSGTLELRVVHGPLSPLDHNLGNQAPPVLIPILPDADDIHTYGNFALVPRLDMKQEWDDPAEFGIEFNAYHSDYGTPWALQTDIIGWPANQQTIPNPDPPVDPNYDYAITTILDTLFINPDAYNNFFSTRLVQYDVGGAPIAAGPWIHLGLCHAHSDNILFRSLLLSNFPFVNWSSFRDVPSNGLGIKLNGVLRLRRQPGLLSL